MSLHIPNVILVLDFNLFFNSEARFNRSFLKLKDSLKTLYVCEIVQFLKSLYCGYSEKRRGHKSGMSVTNSMRFVEV